MPPARRLRIAIAASGPDAGSLRTIYVNDAFTRLTGYPASEVLGTHRSAAYGAGESPSAVAALDQAVAAGGSGELEALHYRKDGSPFLAELRYVPVRDAIRA